jgi:predicted TIM-barrel fold metal-dependent hydrolase
MLQKTLYFVSSFSFITLAFGAGGHSTGRVNGIIDTHLHAIHPGMLAKANEETFGVHGKVGHTMVQDPDTLMQETVKNMNAHGIAMGVLSGDNDMVQKWVQKNPGRFIPSYSPDLSNPAAGIKTFEAEVAMGKWKAMGEVLLPYFGMPLNHQGLFPYYEICEKYSIPVIFHAGLDGPEPQQNLSPVFRVELGNPLLLVDVLVKYPKLRVVIAHLGWPYTKEAAYMLYSYKNVYVDTSVVNWLFNRAFQNALEEMIDVSGGSDRILFGSDQMVWPQMIGNAVQSITKGTSLNDQDRQNILRDNAVRLFGIGKP